MGLAAIHPLLNPIPLVIVEGVEQIIRQLVSLLDPDTAGTDVAHRPGEQCLTGRVVQEHRKGVIEAKYHPSQRVVRPRWLAQQDAPRVIPID